jgi:anti-sigma factor RsiW
MKSHLDDEQFLAALSGPPDHALAAHLAACAACRSELDRLRADLGSLRQSLHAAAAQPEDFWREQRLAVSGRLREAQSLLPFRLATVAALAAMLVLAVSLSLLAPEHQRDAALDADHQLLVDVQDSLLREVPRALEPALLLTAELDRAAQRSQP